MKYAAAAIFLFGSITVAQDRASALRQFLTEESAFEKKVCADTKYASTCDKIKTDTARVKPTPEEAAATQAELDQFEAALDKDKNYAAEHARLKALRKQLGITK